MKLRNRAILDEITRAAGLPDGASPAQLVAALREFTAKPNALGAVLYRTAPDELTTAQGEELDEALEKWRTDARQELLNQLTTELNRDAKERSLIACNDGVVLHWDKEDIEAGNYSGFADLDDRLDSAKSLEEPAYSRSLAAELNDNDGRSRNLNEEEERAYAALRKENDWKTPLEEKVRDLREERDREEEEDLEEEEEQTEDRGMCR
ncbi:hypothetical protein DB347_20860 [Opitutaceae bacterium EW11]|nr:hypothetical protein DB347_20860 [Opitutaceae bacterium EW11]